MKKILALLICLAGISGLAQYRPNYFDTNSSPFGVVPGVSLYVPTVYSTNIVSTNLSVTDFLFIGTAQVNYLTMLGSINQQGVVFTNYFMADTNFFAGSVAATTLFGNIENGTNGIGNPPVFFDTVDQSHTICSLSARAITDDGGNDFNLPDLAVAQSGSFFTCAAQDSSTNGNALSLAFSQEGSQLGLFLNRATNFNIVANDGSGSFVKVLNSSNIVHSAAEGSFGTVLYSGVANVSITAQNGAIVGGTPPSNTTNVHDGVFYYYGNGTFTGGLIIKSNSWSDLIPDMAEGDNLYRSSNGVPHVIIKLGGATNIYRLIP